MTNYEDSIKELEEIVSKLEKEKISLDESVKLFERASALAKFCSEELAKVNGKLFVIKNELEEIVEEDK